MQERIRILGIAGSLRKGSLNRMLLNASREFLPDGVELEVFDLAGIPLYNQDDEDPLPERVAQFKERIKDADAVLIASPEYNHSMTPVIKNALDWATRPPGSHTWYGKPVALMSASDGYLGGIRSQDQLRHVFVDLNMVPINKPEVYVPFAQDKMDVNGKLTDEKVRDRMGKLLSALVDMARKLKKH
ncbi:MAG: NAD(P)H-dependent oxidoreductase [Candidatus Micrarchaeota archaeon]|nr:NAD(P)H-dependent oxidoreductase [Candidatus Micrarchaeota archaeon]